MTKISKTLLVLGTATILSGCGMKANFAKFKAAVGKIKAHEYTKVVAKVDKAEYEGTLQETEILTVKVKVWTPNALTDEKAAEAMVYANMFLEANDAVEERKAEDGEKVTYFVNNLGLEYVNKDGDKMRVEWDKYGLVKSYKYDNKADDSKDYAVSFKYSK